MAPIPRPVCGKGGITSLQDAMGLSADPGTFDAIKKCLRELSKDILDEGHPFGQQDPAKWETFVQKAVARHPLFRRYKNQWPIKWYMRKCLGHTSYNARQQCKLDQSAGVVISGAMVPASPQSDSKYEPECHRVSSKEVTVGNNVRMVVAGEAATPSCVKEFVAWLRSRCIDLSRASKRQA
ncbi:uncharacterized protein FIBRA_07894 [Fibroporia radiculosa]|uniref:Uncharacterized protein n=1 Tax=Fibroporia radiculosa TaxID=599839 RepID=J4H4V8_9APHY|nr:uncharacterized protein FIBRA_07894 [Fibroporia radiculosa]CCM05664.1 predicted protein [Fibroporia radiculosa]